MKAKFVKVLDDLKWGYIPFIILEVEENDKLLLENRFTPGYKFIVQAQYHNVGAVGGYKFNPYEGERVRKISKKIESTEADVLGFYLSNINDIYNIPNELYTENFWAVVRTDGVAKSRRFDEECDIYKERCYKVLLETEYVAIEDNVNSLRDILKEELIDLIDIQDVTKEALNFYEKEKQMMIKNGIDVTKPFKSQFIRIAMIDKGTLKEMTWQESGREDSIAKYLWLPHDELPEDLWEAVKQKNEDYSIKSICKLI